MIFSVVASNEDESRYLCVVADNDVQAMQFVTEAVGPHYDLEVTDLAETVYAQYRGLAELGSLG